MKFVIGREGRFEVGDEIVLMPAHEGRYAFSNRKVKIPESLRLRRAGSSFTLQACASLSRGVAVEGHGYYARVLPEDAEQGLAEIDAAIEAKNKEISALYKERQAFLAAHVVRGERIGKKHARDAKETGEQDSPELRS